jgi:hypothetical protein
VPHYSAENGPKIKEVGRVAIKRANPVYLVKQTEEFSVATNEGVLTGKPGDFVAHDPISGHVWPVSASYVEQHYDFQD